MRAEIRTLGQASSMVGWTVGWDRVCAGAVQEPERKGLFVQGGEGRQLSGYYIWELP